MVSDKFCPLRSDTSGSRKCNSDCAWNVNYGSNSKPECVMMNIAESLYRIKNNTEN